MAFLGGQITTSSDISSFYQRYLPSVSFGLSDPSDYNPATLAVEGHVDTESGIEAHLTQAAVLRCPRRVIAASVRPRRC